jgi:predicted SnoaL-like aldol condensation-catalyzing enzyme
MNHTIESKNKELVLEAFDTLFDKRDYATVEKFWSPSYIQHSAHIPPGRDGLFNLIKSIPPTLRYEPGEIVPENDLVMYTDGIQASASPLTGSWRTLFA